MSGFTIKAATRQGFRPLVGLFGKSGVGKTYSSLILARGFVGSAGKIALVDTESGRGQQYAPKDGESPLPMGAYDVVPFDPPFSPGRYAEAIDFVESQGYSIGIIDSMSHCWEGQGGVLDMAMEIEEKSGRKGLHCWNKPKLDFAMLVLRLQRSAIPWIVCLRAKEKVHQVEKNGRKEIVRDEFTTPITEKDFVFELSCYGELMPDNSFVPLKKMHPTLAACFPDKARIDLKHGQMLAKWCSNPGTAPKSQPTTTTTADPLKALKRELLEVLRPKLPPKPTAEQITQWLVDEALIDPSMTVADLDAATLQAVTARANQKINDTAP